ncbi:aminotransferase class I/II-fold pyridoxal phosphate-dependent enzyme [Clostridium sp. 'deep sea']|uniref:threonine aldolase family protein n=1 Tax=Clostridium sp. 'deep sea' TaxID=2779445 RepID=UPI0018967F23|nr:aminotransferase class I/II-fold pyridoxal phosphate-dependent enzyme [Clostridium sp. 'deep sea']QOR36781.1 aminotransferase class I/II-fold pyridoxal phosphate-dependent enzyme [Clostridium sp. 'deep sea']
MSKKLYSFKNDYSEGAHQNIIKALTETNLVQQHGYGEDDYCKSAKNLIAKHLENKNSQIHFTSGGTQANLVVISSILRPYEAVLSADNGHIYVHETGAIEATGHKVYAVDCKDGKITANMVRKAVNFHADEHMVKIKMVYISNATDMGAVFTKQELSDLRKVCDELGLYLFMDGARLGSALSSSYSDLTLADCAKLTDVFYIGGTKNGALLGEAIVINNQCLQEYFRYSLKQKGALLAKGRLLGLQFYELFKNNLFFDLAKHANKMATILSEELSECGITFKTKPSCNIIFAILPNSLVKELLKKYDFYVIEKHNEDSSVVRLVTSWATPESIVKQFIADLNKLL